MMCYHIIRIYDTAHTKNKTELPQGRVLHRRGPGLLICNSVVTAVGDSFFAMAAAVGFPFRLPHLLELLRDLTRTISISHRKHRIESIGRGYK